VLAGAALALGEQAPGSLGEVLGRPSDHAVTLSVVAPEECDAFVEVFGADGAPLGETPIARLSAAVPAQILLDGLEPDRDYTYRVWRKVAGAAGFAAGEIHAFYTARPPGSTFSFAVQADPHLDGNTSAELLDRSLQNVLGYRPDFLVDLGDTFMSDKFAGTRDEVLARHLLLRSVFTRVCHSVPLFLVLGNHEGESGAHLDGTAENLAVWATTIRKAYFPNPEPDDFYSGDGSPQPFVGPHQSIYAWEWGDALLVVLDPYWFTVGKPGGGADNWVRTLGRDQMRWLEQVLGASLARFKLVFIHNLVGGLDGSMRGGAEAAPFYEWGGRNADGSWGFDVQRPGWVRPVHELLVASGVNVVFHGHDHLYARQELDGVVYQAVPQPGWPGLTLRDPGEYGYRSGTLLPSSGHLRVTVSPAGLTVDYVKSYLDKDQTATRRNGEIAYSYTIEPRPTPRVPRRRLGRKL
jgi:3',5'-cyclic AMP phosphodiesterase CpdA